MLWCIEMWSDCIPTWKDGLGRRIRSSRRKNESNRPRKKNEIYKFLGIEQADGNKTKKFFERVKGEVNKRVKMLNNIELDDVNLLRAINKKVILVAAYSMNVCKFTHRELKDLDQVIRRELRSKNMLGKQSSNERLYLIGEDGERGITSLRDIYKETRLRVAFYMACLQNKWIKAAWR